MKVIGGLFGLADASSRTGSELPFELEGALLTANGTSALHLLVRHLRPNRVWLPSYLCEAVVVAVSGLASSSVIVV